MRKIIMVAFFIFIGSVVTTCHAQETAMSVSPSFYHIITKPGQKHDFTISLKNEGDPQVYVIQLYQLGNPDLNGNLYPLPQNNGPVEITPGEDIVPFGTQFLLTSQQTTKVPLEITIPETKDEGEYFFAIAAETVSSPGTQGAASISFAAGSAVFLNVTITKNNVDVKKIETSLFRAITDFSIPWGNSTLHIVDTGSPVPISLIVKNGAMYSAIPRGTIVVKNQSGDQQRFGIVPVYLYPYSQRLLTTAEFSRESCVKKFSQGLCNGDYSIVLDNLPAGFYEATATVNYGNPSPTIYSRDYFIVIPIFIVSIILLLLTGAIGFVTWAWIRHFKEKNKLNSQIRFK